MEHPGWRNRVLAGFGAALASAAVVLPATAGGAGALGAGVLTLGLMLAARACPWLPGRVAHSGQRHVS